MDTQRLSGTPSRAIPPMNVLESHGDALFVGLRQHLKSSVIAG